MLDIICGARGNGKTKKLLECANESASHASGSVVYLDKSSQHMYELKNNIRLINVKDYNISNASEFFGFLSGIVSSDHDLEVLCLDSFLKLACLEENNPKYEELLDKMLVLSNTFQIHIILSISVSEEVLPSQYKKMIYSR